MKRLLHSAMGSLLILCLAIAGIVFCNKVAFATLQKPLWIANVFGMILFWPMFIFESLFPQPIGYEEFFNVEAGIAALILAFVTYSLLIYAILRLRLKRKLP